MGMGGNKTSIGHRSLSLLIQQGGTTVYADIELRPPFWYMTAPQRSKGGNSPSWSLPLRGAEMPVVLSPAVRTLDSEFVGVIAP